MKEFLFVLRNYANFKGRAGRREYWYYVLVVFGINLLSSIVRGLAEHSIVPAFLAFLDPLITLIFLVPSLAVAARRLHDMNYSGWWQGLPVLFGMLGGAGFAMQIAWLGLPAVVGAIVSAFWLLYLYCRKGDEGENRFGPPAPVIA